MTLDLTRIRAQFPALQSGVVYLDNPGGTQIAARSLERINDYLIRTNANHGGNFETSRASDALVDAARAAGADFLNAASPDEIVFGNNMTTLTFNITRSLAHLLKPSDTIVVTRLDHDANISPWLLLAQDTGCRVRWVDFHPEDGTLDMDDMAAAMSENPKIVAVGYASNALGTINPVGRVVEMAHAAGALVYIDAVQYAPHGPIDVQKLGTDFLVCSSYKFFGPHAGMLYGRLDLLESLKAYRVRPAPAQAPGKFETGTGNFEGMAGLLGALEYLEWLGNTFGSEHAELYQEEYSGRRLAFKQAMAALRSYEMEVNRALLAQLQETPGATVYGITDERRLDQRVATFSFTLSGMTQEAAARALGERRIQVWNGNFYALAVTERLGLEGRGGLIRVGPVHYNTIDEVNLFGQALREIISAA